MWRDKNHRFWTFQDHGWWQLQLCWWHGTDITGGWYLLVSIAWGTSNLQSWHRSKTACKLFLICMCCHCLWQLETLGVWDPGNHFFSWHTQLLLRMAAFCFFSLFVFICLKTTSCPKCLVKNCTSEIASSGVELGCYSAMHNGTV